VKGVFLQQVKVLPGQRSTQPGSYPSGGEGDRPAEASGTRARAGGFASVRAATRVKSEQASKG
jgi:hypothetical protein